MNTQTIIFGLVLIIIVAYFIGTKIMNQKAGPDTARPSNLQIPKQEIQNDKLVVIDDITNEEIDSILTGFCNLYNKDSYQAQPRLYSLSERQFAVTFPFDIEFEMFCYFVNYVRYPMGFDKSFNVIAWTTTKSGQTWITNKSANKKVMLFIPIDDTEHDNVYLSTDDNIGYKLGFATGEKKQQLASPKKLFVNPNIEITELKNKDYKDYK